MKKQQSQKIERKIKILLLMEAGNDFNSELVVCRVPITSTSRGQYNTEIRPNLQHVRIKVFVNTGV